MGEQTRTQTLEIWLSLRLWAAFFGARYWHNDPSVALMSIGEEDMRGNDLTETFKLLKASGLNFRAATESIKQEITPNFAGLASSAR